jgi:hypothetical protein
MRKRSWTFAAATAVVAGALAVGGFAGAEEPEEGGGMPPPQAKIESAFVKGLVGTWGFEATMQGQSIGKGSITYRLGLGGTAVVEDLEGEFMGGPFHGHGVWKVDGKTLKTWWFDNFESKAQAYEGTLGDEGYEIVEQDSEAPTRITLKKSATGHEMLFKSPQGEMKIALTKQSK